jgi:hypothetical protein
MNSFKFLILFLAVISSQLKANNGTADVLKNASHTIKENLKMPVELAQEHCSQKITIYFSVNENGDVTKVNVKTKNLEVKKNLENQFRHLHFKGLKPSVLNSIDVNFKVC